MATKKYLITSALPYANGPLHFGHLTGVYLPADIYTRHRKLQGHRVLHISGSDEHGVAIMLQAEKEKKPYPVYVNEWHAAHRELFQDYGIEFDFFGQTSAAYHREEVVRWFQILHKNGYIGKKSEDQLYCEDDGRFLPDRYVEGTCYACKYPQARGDECPNCGEWIDALRLIDPVSKISGSRKITIKKSTHYYLLLTKLEKEFRQWFGSKETSWRKLVVGFVRGLLQEGMIDRAISRDLDWGIDVPLDEADARGKKLYVWFDAPIGYVSNTRQCLEGLAARGGPHEDYLTDWWNAQDTVIQHFIGKDNIIFHAVIWPCMALGTGRIQLPTDIPANEFLNLEGKQFSKSSGWYVDAKKAIDEFGPDALRIYLCSLIPESGDTSFTWSLFGGAVEDFGNKIGNFVHRSFSFMTKHWPDGLSADAFAQAARSSELEKIRASIATVTAELDQCRITIALQQILHLGQHANEFFHVREPWKQAKTDKTAAEETLAISVYYSAVMGVLLQPFVPRLAGKLLRHFEGYWSSDDIAAIYCGDLQRLVRCLSKGYKNPHPPEVLLPRIDPKRIEVHQEELRAKVSG